MFALPTRHDLGGRTMITRTLHSVVAYMNLNSLPIRIPCASAMSRNVFSDNKGSLAPDQTKGPARAAPVALLRPARSIKGLA
jgi:hypothetical protein